MTDKKILLSTLWIFVLFNYIYADILVLILNPSVYQNAATKMGIGPVLAFSILMEIPIAMVVLSRILNYNANRWANIIAGIVSTLFVAMTLFGGNPPGVSYVFFSSIEIATTLFITWYAWKWRGE
jgi:hypothetical protein